jgi:SAM-dependent methyltransferase
MDWYRVAFGKLYPLVYAHRDDAEATRAADGLAPLLDTGAPLLDVACGAGRYTTAFRRAGFDAIGLDLSDFLLEEAVTRRGLAGRVVVGDMRVLPFRDDAVGSVVNMFTSFGYFDDDHEHALVLGEIARVLRPGGNFIMDFINAGSLGEVPPETTARREGDVVIEETRALRDGGRVLTKRVCVRPAHGPGTEYEERVRLFRARELERMFMQAGLSVLDRFGDYGRDAFDEANSSRLILVARKVAA